MKYLNFSVAETSGRTFELPLDKALELIKADNNIDLEGIDLNDEREVARVLKDYFLDDIAEFEKANDYWEMVLCDSDIKEASEV